MTQLGMFGGVPRDALGYLQAAGATPGTFYRANLPRVGLVDDAGDTGHVSLVTQVMTSVPIALAAGDVVTNISFRTGATAAGTPTNWWVALYSAAATPALLSQSADQLTGAMAANTTFTKALAAAQTISVSGIYWVGIHVKATTVPTLLGCLGAPAIVTGERNLSQSSGTSLAGVAPATITSVTAKDFVPYVVVT